MNEKQWNSCTDPRAMLDFLRASGKASDRKLRLFAVACCRRIWALMPDDRLRLAVSTVEQLADSRATSADRKAARRAAQLAQQAGSGVLANRVGAAVFALGGREIRRAILQASQLAAEAGAASRTDWLSSEWRASFKVERTAQSHLLHDLFHSLVFREVHINPLWLRWNDGTIRRIAEGIYEERAFERMGVLADALLDSGCDDEDMLAHCREQGIIHSKGCWVIDLLLGKE